jgi:hypothetical protein
MIADFLVKDMTPGGLIRNRDFLCFSIEKLF